jgi:uncharacterized membrane protein YvbJ
MATIHCTACGTENPEGSVYCRECARRLDDATQEDVVQRRTAALEVQPTRLNWFAIGIALLILALIIAIIVGLLVTHVAVVLVYA